MSSTPRLPPADSWDRRTGLNPVHDFEVMCQWTPVNRDWAILTPMIMLHDGAFALSKDVEVLRVYREVGGDMIESPELTALAWTKKALGSGGVLVTGLHQVLGHVSGGDGIVTFRWQATVASRLSVAVHRLEGNLEGQARLVLVE